MDDPATARGGRDWRVWHDAYADPASAQSRRLAVVRRRIGEALDASAGPVSILSLCAGDGRDLVPELAARPGRAVSAVLVELDEHLADGARARVAAAGVNVEVRTADAGSTRTFADVVPVDLLLLCGIFGNVTGADIRRTVDAVPALLTPGGTAIWTRGRFADGDLRPQVRRWFVEAGMEEVAFDGAPERFGVGVARAGDADRPVRRHAPVPARLFAFDAGGS